MKYIEEFKTFLNSFEGLEIQDKFDQFNVFYLLNDYNSIESERTVPDLLRYDLAAFTQVVQQLPQPNSIEEAKVLYEQIIDHTVPCLDPADGDFITAGDYRNMLHALVSLSFVLSHIFPAYFIPYLYRYKMHQLAQTAEACDFELPAMPKADDWRGRCMYYWELCETLYNFRMKHDLISAELWPFLYHFAPACLPMIDFGNLPAPTHIWWVGKRESIDEYRNTTLMHLRNSARKGDLLARYEAAPTQGITGFWRVLSDPIIDPIDPQYTYCYVGNRLHTPLLSYAELKADAYFSKHPLFKRRFLNSDGRMISEADLKQLLQMLQAKGFDCQLELL